MNETTAPVFYKGFRFPQEIITHAVWLYLYRAKTSSKLDCKEYHASFHH